MAHGNSLRALVKMLDGMSERDIVEFNIPTGFRCSTNSTTPFVPSAAAFSATRDAVAAAQDAVRRQTEKK